MHGYSKSLFMQHATKVNASKECVFTKVYLGVVPLHCVVRVVFLRARARMCVAGWEQVWEGVQVPPSAGMWKGRGSGGGEWASVCMRLWRRKSRV